MTTYATVRSGACLGRRPAGDLSRDLVVDLAARKLRGDPDRVLDSIRVRTAMANDAHAFDPQQGGAAKLRVIDPLAKIGKPSL